MSIAILSVNQINVVSGGDSSPDQENREEIYKMNNFLGDCITRAVGSRDLRDCLVPVKCGDNCVTRCIPKKKPRECDYSAWGMLHDLEEGTIQKCE